jgi:hypothetical protein
MSHPTPSLSLASVPSHPAPALAVPATFPVPGHAPAAPPRAQHGDQLVRATLPLALAYCGVLLYGAYLLGLVSVNGSDWAARLLLACFTLPGVMQGSAAARGLVARARGASAPGWWRLVGHGVRAAGGVVLAFTLVALPPHTALYVGTAAVIVTLGEAAWSLTEAGSAWRGLRQGRPLGRRARVAAAVAAAVLVGGPLLLAATRRGSTAVAVRAAELPARATLETVVASLRDTRAKRTVGMSKEARALAPYPFDTIGLAADLARRPVPGIGVAYWTTPGGGFVATATRADGRAKCVAALFPGALRDFWCTSDAATPAVLKPLLRPTTPSPRRAWRWVAPS